MKIFKAGHWNEKLLMFKTSRIHPVQAILWKYLSFSLLIDVSSSVAGVKDVIVWGNVTGCTYIDLSHAKLYRCDSAIWGPANFSRPLLNLIYDRYVQDRFVLKLKSLLYICVYLNFLMNIKKYDCFQDLSLTSTVHKGKLELR